MSKNAIVTREWIQNVLNSDDENKKVQLVDRACVVLFNRQTETEKSANTTNNTNFRGFTQADARSGSLTAKYFLKHKTLQPWQVERWVKPNKNGVTRIAKYHAQLNEEAERKKG